MPCPVVIALPAGGVDRISGSQVGRDTPRWSTGGGGVWKHLVASHLSGGLNSGLGRRQDGDGDSTELSFRLQKKFVASRTPKRF